MAENLRKGREKLAAQRIAEGKDPNVVTLPPPAENELPVGRLSEGDHARVMLRRVLRDHRGRAGAPTELPTLPGIQSLSMATRYLDGGREQFLEIVQMAMLNNDPVACKWWAVYADLAPYPRSIVSFDDVCAAAGVEPAKLVAVMVSTAMTFGRDIANMVAAFTHPKVLAAQVRSAERIDGDYAEIALRDRMAFLQGMGFLPVPKGTTVNVHASANAQAAAAVAQEPTVPNFAADLGAVVPAGASAVRQLPEADQDLAPIEGVVESVGIGRDE